MEPTGAVRAARGDEARVVAELLDAFNREYDTATPGPEVLTQRLTRLLAGGSVVALLVGEPAIGVALLTLRPNVWYDGPVALLDELYVAPQHRGKGLGSALLDAAEGVTRDRDGELLEINVDGDDIDARRFYERHGYSNHEAGKDEQLLYYYRELTRAAGPPG
jgi:GNAT superfamily N-acetyltransferase